MLIPNLRKYSSLFLFAFTILMLILILIEFSSLGFHPLQSDVAAYWNDSINWQTPYHSFHVPGYPLLIAILRGITAELLSPLTYMIVITTTSLLVGMVIALKLGTLFSGSTNTVGLLMSFLLAFWPLSGLYAVIYPIADYVVIAFFLLGLLLFMRNQPLFGSIAWAGAVITHKAIWPFVAFSFLVWVYYNRKMLRFRWIIYSLVIITPLLLIWFGGIHYHNDWRWILSSNLTEIQDNKVWYPFHGIIESFQLGDIASLLKGGVTAAFVFLAVFLAIYLLVRKPEHFLFGLAIILASLVMAMSMNEGLTWGFVRFSRLLVVPFGLVSVDQFLHMNGKMPKWQRTSFVVICMLCVLSQFVYAYYMGRYYYM